MSLTQPFPLGTYQTDGNDFSINAKQYPGLTLVPTAQEPNGLYSAFREINGAQWIMQNADINALGFYILNPAAPAFAFVLLQGGGLAMYTAPGNSTPGFTWTRLFFVNNAGVLQTPTASIENHVFDVTDYGAVGGNATLDQQGFNNAIAAMNLAGGGELFIPRPPTGAAYLLLSPCTAINVQAGVLISGQGNVSAITTPNDIIIFSVGTTGYPPGSNGFTAMDFQMNCTAATPSTGYGIKQSFVSDFRYLNLSIFGFFIPIGLFGRNFGRCISVSGCTLQGYNAGLYTENGVDVSHCQSIGGNVYGMIMNGCPGTCHLDTVTLYGQLSLVMQNTAQGTGGQSTGSYNALWATDVECNYEDPPGGVSAPTEGRGSMYLAHSTGDVHLNRCWNVDGTIIGSTNGGVAGAPENPQPYTITDCEFGNYSHSGSPVTAHALEIVNGSHFAVANNSFVVNAGHAGDGLRVDATVSKISITGNKIFGSPTHGINLFITDYFALDNNVIEGVTAANAIWFGSGGIGSVNIGIHAYVGHNPGATPRQLYQNIFPNPFTSPVTLQNVTGYDGYYLITTMTGGSPATITEIDVQQNPADSGSFQPLFGLGTTNPSGGVGAPPFAFLIPVPAGGAIKFSFSGTPTANNDLRVQFVSS